MRAGVKPAGKHVMFGGLDEVPGKVPPFIRSIPIEKAIDGDTLVALNMNGARLTKHHGFPARVVVPGWIGAATCKWVTEIKVLDREFDGNFMSPGYRMPNQPVQPGEAVNVADTHPATALKVKSLIASPSDGASVKSRAIHIQGVAWAGEADIEKVEVSTDSGTTWQPAQLSKNHSRYAWRHAESADLLPGPVPAKFKTACLECHDAGIIVQQRLNKAAWTKEMDKMIKWGAVVDPGDRDVFIEYLTTKFPTDKEPYVAPRTAFKKMKHDR